MARIRTIKPELFISTSRRALSLGARVLWPGIFTQADDYGRLLDAPKALAGALFPYDDGVDPKQVTEWLDELVDAGWMARYEVDGARYLHVVGWKTHQRIPKPTPSRLPPPPGVSDDSVENPGKSGESPVGSGSRNIGKGTRKTITYSSDEEVIWKLLPRGGKAAAAKAYRARRAEGVSHDTLLVAVQQYAQECVRRRTETQYIKHLSGFLAPGGRWEEFAPRAPVGPTEEDLAAAAIWDAYELQGGPAPSRGLKRPSVGDHFVAGDGSWYDLDASGDRKPVRKPT